jgi:acyl-CoA thioesterase
MTKSSRQMIWIRQLAREMPFYNHLGIHLTRLGTGRAEIRIKVTKRLTQDAGVAHGGVAAALIDSAVGLALCTMLDAEEFITTVELKVNFTAPAQLGLLKASGQIIHKGKRIAVGEAEVKDQKRRLIAKGLVTYIIMKK